MSDTPQALTAHRALEIRIASVGLVPKLDAIGAALEAVREAHRDEMTPGTWSAINRAREEIATAMMSAGRAGGAKESGVASFVRRNDWVPNDKAQPAGGNPGST